MNVSSPALSDEDLGELRGILQRLRDENEADVRRASETLADLSADGLLVNPSMREISTNAEYLLEDARGILAKIDAAERRLEAGTFGTCTSCGGSIPLGRLRLRPYQPTCVACSS